MDNQINIEEIIEFINNEFPDECKDVSTAIDLLAGEITDLNIKIAASYSKYSDPKYADKFNLYRQKSLLLYKIVDELNRYIEQLTPDFDLLEIEDENDDIDKLLNSEDGSSAQIKLLEKLNLSVDYSDVSFNADTTVRHNLYENFTHKRPCAFELNETKIEADQWRELLKKTCDYLYNLPEGKNKFEEFINAPEMNGISRKYFSHNKSEVSAPQRIDKSDIYVIGNVSAQFTRNLIMRLLNKFQIPKKNYCIFIQRDLSSLHIQDKNVEKAEKTISDKKDITVDSEQKIGQYARTIFTSIFKNPISQTELDNMQCKEWSHDNLGIRYPLLKKYINGVPIKEQCKYNDRHSRYYKDTLIINGEQYFLCSQWFEEFRPKIDKWLLSRDQRSVEVTNYCKIIHNSYSINIEDNIVKILLKAFLDDFDEHSVININRIRNEYEDFIKNNTKYIASPQTVLYCLAGCLKDLGIIKLYTNSQKGKYVIKNRDKLIRALENPEILSKNANT